MKVYSASLSTVVGRRKATGNSKAIVLNFRHYLDVVKLGKIARKCCVSIQVGLMSSLAERESHLSAAIAHDLLRIGLASPINWEEATAAELSGFTTDLIREELG